METVVHVEDGKYLGQTRYAPTLLRESLALCVKEVAGVAWLGKRHSSDTRGIEIKHAKDSSDLIINVFLSVLSGYAVSDVAYRVQEAVINNAAQLTSDKIDRVNIYVKGTQYAGPQSK